MRFAAMCLVAMAACAKPGVQPKQMAVTADSADQVMHTMTFNITSGGMRLAFVQADSAWIYQARQVADLRHVTTTFFDSSGKTISTITANGGTYHIREQMLDARGSVVAVTPGGKTLKTEHLVYDKIQNRIASDTFFTSTASGKGGGILSGDNFESDPDFKHIEVTRPHGQMKGKGILLPGEKGGGGT